MRFSKKMLMLSFLVLIADCSLVEEAIPESSLTDVESDGEESMMLASPPVKVDVDTESESELEEDEVGEDPYSDYDSWCEDVFKTTCECPGKDPIVCEAPKKACPLDRTGKAQRCIRPQWSRREGSWVYLCDPGRLNRGQQKRQRQTQRIIVDALCKEPSWTKDLAQWGDEHRYGNDPSKLCWHLPGGSSELKECMGKHYCQPEKLSKFLALVAARESTWNNTTSHELNFDVDANRASYAKARKKGWYEGNPHFYDPSRWARGYGWYGQNAALNVFRWDTKAPPELLCRRVESTEIYLRSARKSFRKLWGMYGDDKERVYLLDTGEEVKVKGVTWYDVHRAVAGGKLYPEKVISTKKGGFIARTKNKRTQLDPFEAVTWEMLGEPIPQDRQNEIANEIRQIIEEHFQPPAREAQLVGG